MMMFLGNMGGLGIPFWQSSWMQIDGENEKGPFDATQGGERRKEEIRPYLGRGRGELARRK